MIINLYSQASVALIVPSLAKINGLMYNELPNPVFIHCASIFKRAFKPSKNNSFGNLGIASLSEDFIILL